MTFTGTATGCANPLYQFWLLAPGGNWTLVQDWGGASLDWKTTGLSVGTYTIEVRTQQSGDLVLLEAYSDLSYTLAFALGDVNGDGNATSVDALCILRLVAKLPATGACPSPLPGNPDVNGDNQVTSVDALCVLRLVAKLPATPACSAPSSTASRSAASAAAENGSHGTVDLSLQPGTGRPAGHPGTTIEVHARVTGAALGSWTVDVVYDPRAVKVTGCEAVAGGICNASYGPGVVRITGASGSGLTDDQTLATIELQGAGRAGGRGLTLGAVALTDSSGAKLGQSGAGARRPTGAVATP